MSTPTHKASGESMYIETVWATRTRDAHLRRGYLPIIKFRDGLPTFVRPEVKDAFLRRHIAAPEDDASRLRRILGAVDSEKTNTIREGLCLTSKQLSCASAHDLIYTMKSVHGILQRESSSDMELHEVEDDPYRLCFDFIAGVLPRTSTRVSHALMPGCDDLTDVNDSGITKTTNNEKDKTPMLQGTHDTTIQGKDAVEDYPGEARRSSVGARKLDPLSSATGLSPVGKKRRVSSPCAGDASRTEREHHLPVIDITSQDSENADSEVGIGGEEGGAHLPLALSKIFYLNEEQVAEAKAFVDKFVHLGDLWEKVGFPKSQVMVSLADRTYVECDAVNFGFKALKIEMDYGNGVHICDTALYSYYCSKDCSEKDRKQSVRTAFSELHPRLFKFLVIPVHEDSHFVAVVAESRENEILLHYMDSLDTHYTQARKNEIIDKVQEILSFITSKPMRPLFPSVLQQGRKSLDCGPMVILNCALLISSVPGSISHRYAKLSRYSLVLLLKRYREGLDVGM